MPPKRISSPSMRHLVSSRSFATPRPPASEALLSACSTRRRGCAAARAPADRARMRRNPDVGLTQHFEIFRKLQASNSGDVSQGAYFNEAQVFVTADRRFAWILSDVAGVIGSCARIAYVPREDGLTALKGASTGEASGLSRCDSPSCTISPRSDTVISAPRSPAYQSVVPAGENRHERSRHRRQGAALGSTCAWHRARDPARRERRHLHVP
jgi:hypothetical protein